MDEQRKHAYRYLLYWAMLDIRPLAGLGERWFGWWNPFFWRKEVRRIRCAGAIANWLHNLALYSSVNFDGFNEHWFWRDFLALKKRYPEFGLQRYLSLFEQHLESDWQSGS